MVANIIVTDKYVCHVVCESYTDDVMLFLLTLSANVPCPCALTLMRYSDDSSLLMSLYDRQRIISEW